MTQLKYVFAIAFFSISLLFTLKANTFAVPKAESGYQDRELDRAAEKLYKSALKNFDNQAYWKASRELIILLDFYTGFNKTDGVLYYLGQSLYEMNMFRSSDKVFRYLTSQYPDSDFLARALLGLQRVHFVTQNFEESLKYFEGITTRHRDDRVLDAAYYYGAMTFFYRKEYDKAIATFKHIRSRSEFFEYGLYNIGLAFLKKKNIANSAKAFRKLITLPVISAERQDVIVAAHLTLGYLYYELGFYREAIKHLLQIPADDPVYPDALLARSWSAIKLNDYQQAIVTLNEIIKVSSEDKYNEEAHFLLGQSYLQLGFYDFAVAEFNYIIEKYPAGNNFESTLTEVEASLAMHSKEAEDMRVELLMLESKLLDMIPLNHQASLPKYLKDEKKRLEDSRDSLVKNILEERKIFDSFQWSIQKLREDIALKRSRKHWRAYAEYGKTRGYFLKTMQSN